MLFVVDEVRIRFAFKVNNAYGLAEIVRSGLRVYTATRMCDTSSLETGHQA